MAADAAIQARSDPVASLRRFTRDKVSEFPAAASNAHSGAITLIVVRVDGELARCDHVHIARRKLFSQDGAQFRPDVVLVPIAEDSLTGWRRIPTISKI